LKGILEDQTRGRHTVDLGARCCA